LFSELNIEPWQTVTSKKIGFVYDLDKAGAAEKWTRWYTSFQDIVTAFGKDKVNVSATDDIKLKTGTFMEQKLTLIKLLQPVVNALNKAPLDIGEQDVPSLGSESGEMIKDDHKTC
jgi:hypothetical protein